MELFWGFIGIIGFLGSLYLIYESRSIVYVDLSAIRVIVISSNADWDNHRDLIVRTCRGLVGLDCEWVSTGGSRHRIALLQLSPSESLCFLIRLQKLRSIPIDLQLILGDHSIVKCGVAVENDAKYLSEDYGSQCNSWLDLRHMALRHPSTRDVVRGLSLQALAKTFLGIDLDKKKWISWSNWEAEHSSADQIQYAANDAVASFAVAKRIAMLVASPLDILTETPATIIREKFSTYLDLPFRNT